MSDEIRLYFCDGGTIELPLRNFKAGEGLGGETVVTPVSWYVLTHPRGNVVIDGGNAAEVADDIHHVGGIADLVTIEMRPEHAVLPTLARIGVAPESVRWIVQSHLHYDHTGALAAIDAFPNAEVLVTRTEHEWAHAPDDLAAPLYCLRDYAKPGVRWSLLEATDDGWDVFGDGVLRCWRTPGHAPGHQSFEVHLASGASFVLAVDAAYSLDHLYERAIPTFLVSASDTLASVRKLRRLAWRADATVVAGHDLEQWTALRRGPEFYA